MEVLKEGYRIPFSTIPPLAKDPIMLSSYAPNSIRGRALAKEIDSLIAKGAVELAPRTPGYYSLVFCCDEGLENLAPNHRFVPAGRICEGTKFTMEIIQSVLASVSRNDWIVSLDLKDAYLQISVHPESRRFPPVCHLGGNVSV